MPLNCEINTPEMDSEIQVAAESALCCQTITTFFEHGQWWVENLDTGAQWSVNDGNLPPTSGGFCFEQVTEGSVD